MQPQTDSLTDRRRGPVRERHEPRTRGRGRKEVGDQGGDAGAEGEPFEGLVEGDGDEEDDEGSAGGDGESHTDEDAVEEDASFQEEALEKEASGVVLSVGVVGIRMGMGMGVVGR